MFTLDLAAADSPPLFGLPSFTTVVLVPDERLLLVGTEADSVLAVVDDAADSFADIDGVDEIVDGEDGLEAAIITGGDAACQMPPSASHEMLEQLGDTADLAAPQLTFTFIRYDEEPVTGTRLRFASEEVASADAEVRENYLREGRSLITAQPFPELFDLEDVTVDGPVQSIDYTMADGPEVLQQMTTQLGLPFIACPSG